jgi:hypothetical protein
MKGDESMSFRDFDYCLIVFICKLDGILDIENIARYFPVFFPSVDPVVVNKKIKFYKDESVAAASVLSMFHINSTHVIQRGTLMHREKCFKASTNIESKMYSHRGNVLTTKIFREIVHVTAAKDIDRDTDTIKRFVSLVNHYDTVIQRISMYSSTVKWFIDHIKCDGVVETDETGEVYVRDVSRERVEYPSESDEEVLDYLYQIAQEFDSYKCLMKVVRKLSGDIRLIDDSISEQVSVASVNISSANKWINFGWYFNTDMLARLLDEIPGYRVTYDPASNTDLSCVDTTGKANVTFNTKSSSVFVFSKRLDVMEERTNVFISILLENKSDLVVRV